MKKFLNKHRSDLIIIGVLTIIATVFVFLFSISTSPIYRDYYAYAGLTDGGDSVHFQTDGQNWLNGKIPYRDAFDHKGPIIFLVNMIGLFIGGGSRYGIMVIQILALVITLFFVWRISQLAKKSYLWGGISVFVTLVFMSASYAMGNSVQEYNLPFILAAIYLMVRFFYQKKLGEHNPWWAFAYGVAVGSCLLLQATHAIPIGAGALVIAIMLVAQKRWDNLWKNLLFGVAGVLTIWLPFALYFLVCGAFGDFIYCTIIFNFSYAGKIGSWLTRADGNNIRYFIMTYFPFFCALGASILAFVRGRKAYAVMLLITFALEAYLFLSAESFSQYILPGVFQVGLFLNEVILFERKGEVQRMLYIGMVCLLTIMTYNQVVERSMLLMDQYNAVRKAGRDGLGYEVLMDKYLDAIRGSSFTVFGDADVKGLYVRYNLTPQNKFFLIQNWCASFTEKIWNETKADFENNPAEYILVDNTSLDNPTSPIGDTIRANYKKIDSDEKFSMYKLKEQN